MIKNMRFLYVIYTFQYRFLQVSSEIQNDSHQTSMDDFCDEILLAIMMNYGKYLLRRMAFVSKRFRAIAKDAFGKLYCGTGKKVNIDAQKLNKRPYKNIIEELFTLFGEKMSAIDISFGNNFEHNDL